MRLWHDLTLDDYEARYGKLAPMTPEEAESHVITVRCDEDRCDTAYSTATGTRWPQQALISHMWGRHAIKMSPRNVRGEL